MLKFEQDKDEILSLLWNNNVDSLLIVDSDLVVRKSNHSSSILFLKPEDEIINTHISSLWNCNSSEQIKLLGKIFENDNTTTVPFCKIKLWNGNSKWMKFTYLIARTNNNAPYAIIACREIPETKISDFISRENKNLFTDIFENSPLGITVFIDEIVAMANRSSIKMFGYTNEYEVIGKKDSNFIAPESLDILYNKKSIKGFKYSDSYELTGLKKDGSKFPLRIYLVSVKINDVFVEISFFTDITEQKAYENEIRDSLKEKELLLKEIHHRVKNNLQIISSLLSLQSEFITNTDLLNMFNDSKNRIKTMALIHERLYQSENLSKIQFDDYIKRLIEFLRNSYASNTRNIKFEIYADAINLPIDIAIPCGLIINELVTNSFKYAFNDNPAGVFYISFKEEAPSEYSILIGDNGNGLPEDLNFKDTQSLGFQLVCALTAQIDGTIEYDGHNGTSFLIKFKI